MEGGRSSFRGGAGVTGEVRAGGGTTAGADASAGNAAGADASGGTTAGADTRAETLVAADATAGSAPAARPQNETGSSRGRQRISSGGPWETIAGYSRAIVVGDSCWVAGTTDAGADGASRHPGDVVGQARAVFAIIEQALADGGFSLVDVVRTRMFVVDMADSAAVSAVHGEIFGEIRPAATLVAVAGLMHPSLLVEIEAEASKG